MKTIVVFGVVALVGVSGCLPSRPTVTPAVSGRILLNGTPVAGAKVYVVDRLKSKDCSASKLEATTSPSGVFSIESTRAFEWSMPGDRLVDLSVCVNYNGEWVMGYRESHVGYPRSKVHLECDLSAPGRSVSTTNGSCRESDA